MEHPIITLTTDFGLSDPFVGIMKGVILGIAPGARVVDITHEIPSHDIAEAAFAIDFAHRYFPDRSIHVVVVDPGVGSARRPIAAAVRGQVFVAPDNGVLARILEAPAEVYHITNTGLFRRPVSRTFHGRDIFAPVAAHLASGTALASIGSRIEDYVMLPASTRPSVLRVDKFGNVITNLRLDDLPAGFAIRIGGRSVRRLLDSYEDAAAGEVFAIEGSAGFIEISVKRGSAAKTLQVGAGAEIEVETGHANQ
jgi:S-adenosylmethionine hydrolase